MVSSDLAGFTTQCGDAPFDGEIFRLAKTSCAVFPSIPCTSQTKR